MRHKPFVKRLMRPFFEQPSGRHPIAAPRAMESGVSLVSVLMAVAITGIVVMVISRMNVNSIKAQRRVEQRSDLESIRRTIRDAIDCRQTLDGYCPGGSCDAGEMPGCSGLVPLFRKATSAGQILVAGTAPVTKFGGWAIRASCSAAGLDIRAARPRPGVTSLNSVDPNDFNQDPLVGTVLSWDSPRSSLFDAGAAPCQNYFSGFSSNIIQVTGNMFEVDCDCPAVGGGGATNLGCINHGSASCPAGYTLISGGVDCRFVDDVNHIGNNKVVMSRPSGNSWEARCCMKKGPISPDLSNRVYAICMKEQ